MAFHKLYGKCVGGHRNAKLPKLESKCHFYWTAEGHQLGTSAFFLAVVSMEN